MQEPVSLARTIKVRVYLDDPNDSEKLSGSQEAFRLACNHVSQYIFDHEFILNYRKLHDLFYNELRSRFSLKSQMAQSVIKCVIARYKAVRTQLSKQEVCCGIKEDGSKVYCRKDLTFLQKPIYFSRPQIDLVRNRDYSHKESVTSINTIYGRVKVSTSTKGFESYLDGSWKLGTAKLLKSGGKWYLHVSVTKDVETDFKPKKILGIDRGLRQILTVYDGHKTVFINGQNVKHTRNKYKNKRAELQAKGTKSAKRRLKAIGSRESRWMSDVNHCLSKTLVDQHGSNTLFVLENLKNITSSTVKNRKKEDRYEHHSWSYYDFEQKLTYKARAKGSEVISVNPKYTSQRCPKCERIDKDNRNHEKHEFCCKSCGYKTNDDRAAAMNIRDLGILYTKGVIYPKYNKS